MAKRFTDTEKWKRPWYRKLPPPMRELWNYILDSCDHAGIWMEDIELASMILGLPIEQSDYQKYLGPKLVRVDEDKVFVPSFVEFQYGEELDAECRTHQSVIKVLERHGIDRVSLQLVNPIESVTKGIDTLKDKDKDKDTDRDQEKDKEPEIEKTTRPHKFDFEPIYEEYPRKDGKSEGLKVCKAKIRTQEEYDKLLSAVRRYRAHCEQEITDKQYIKHFSSFMNKDRWRDWLDPATGTAIEVSPTSHIDWSKFT